MGETNFLRVERAVLNAILPGLDGQLRDLGIAALEDPASNAGIAAFRAAGGASLLIPKRFLGKGCSPVESVQIQRAIGSRAPSLAVATTMHHFSVAMILPVCQNPAGMEWVLLQAIAQQNLLLASGFAEGESGRGALHPAMRASKTAQGVLVSGSKRPCSLSKSMNILTASALVYPDGAGEGRFAVLLIPAESAGIERRPFWKSPVLGAAESDELLLKDVFVPDRLVFYPERNVGENSLEGSGFLWFELLISAAYLGIASALAERVLTGNRGSAQDRVALVTELESAMSAIENVAHALGEGACGQREISRALFVRFGAQKAIERASALAFDLLGGMAFAGSPDAAYLYAAARALAFHPPSRLACTPSLDAFAMGGELRLE